MIFRSYIIVIIMVFFSALAEAKNIHEPQSPFAGTWKNQAGSHVRFTVKDGEVRGTYQTNVGQPDKNQSFALIGFTEGDQITFSVNFKGFGSLTAWTGQLTKDKNGTPYIRTLWHLTRDIPDDKEQDDIWMSINTGASDFVWVD